MPSLSLHILEFRSDPLCEILDDSGRFDAEKIEEWMHKNMIDPNDPRNVLMMKRISELSKGSELIGVDQQEHMLNRCRTE